MRLTVRLSLCEFTMQCPPHSQYRPTALITAMLIALMMIALFPSATLGQSSGRARVLVLNSYHVGMPWEDRLNKGLLAELRRSGLELDVFIEYMDTKRLPRDRLFMFLAALYAEKYTDPPDIILATDDSAIDFLLEHRETLFPNVPVVFGGVNKAQKAQRIQGNGFTGLIETVDIKRTLELMLKLHPNLTQVIAIADATPSSHARLGHYQQVAADITADRTSNIAFNSYKNWTFDELIDTLKALPPHTALLYLSANRDRNGNLPPSAAGLTVLTENTSAPIYTLWQSHGIGDGIIGGFVADGLTHGRIMGEYAVRILKGESVHDLPIIHNVGNRPIFDYNMLMAYRIDLSSLPPDRRLVNEPQSFYYRYYKVIWGTIGFVTLEATIIAILIFLINKSRRRERETLQRANAELERRVADRTQELEQRTQELERFNNELDQFTYVASHDLQEPVRNLVSYSTLLKEDLGNALSEDVAEDLFYITSAASRMQQLVQDLLTIAGQQN